jgi:hypothetical protein
LLTQLRVFATQGGYLSLQLPLRQGLLGRGELFLPRVEEIFAYAQFLGHCLCGTIAVQPKAHGMALELNVVLTICPACFVDFTHRMNFHFSPFTSVRQIEATSFVNQGEISSTRFVLPSENGLSIKAEGGTVNLQSLNVYPLNSAWKDGIGD